MNYFEVGQRIEIIEIDDMDELWFKLGAVGRIVEVCGDGTLDIDFSESPDHLYTTQEDGRACWYVSEYQVKILD